MLSTLIAFPARGQWNPPNRCDIVDFTASLGACESDSCRLWGGVFLQCDDLRLWSKAIDINLHPDRSFAGAVAEGDVLMVDGNTVVQCERLVLAEDQIQGRIDTAVIRMKPPNAPRDSRGVPTGRDDAIFKGTFERTAPEHITVTDGSYTLCDCGKAPPAWALSSPKIDVELGERAWVWWPVFSVSPLGLFTVPVTPPLLPTSIPLKSRAIGFLPPVPQFLGGFGAPLVDLPFFLPFGNAWDVTITPGMRFDWGTRTGGPDTWGAPRLGTRLRYAPLPKLHGKLTVQWTHDGEGGRARDYLELVDDPTNPAVQAESERLRALVNRVSVDWDHAWELTPNLHWSADAAWISDDLVADDFRVSFEERSPNYLPSRTQLLWRGPGWAGSLGADYLLRVNPQGSLSNVDGAEETTGHRGPALTLDLLPMRLAGPVYASARMSFVRYGPWVPGFNSTQSLLGGTLNLSVLESWGPLELRGFGNLDLLRVEQPDQRPFLFGSTVAGFDLETTLAGRWGSWLHTLRPRLTYRVLPWLNQGERTQIPVNRDDNKTTERVYVDERLAVQTFHQAAVGVSQSWHSSDTPQAPFLQLDIMQPFDLNRAQALPLRVAADARLGAIGIGGWLDSLPIDGEQPIREVGGNASYRMGPFSADVIYTWRTGRAERFRRNLWEIAAPERGQPFDQWSHRLEVGQGIRVGGLDFTYRAVVGLPIVDKNAPTGTPGGLANHIFTLSYSSRCNQCWNVTARLEVPPDNPEDFRLGLNFSLAGLSVGL